MSKKKTPKPAPLSLTEQEQLLGWAYLGLELLALPTAITLLGAQFGGFSDSVTNFIYYLTNGVCCGLIFRKVLQDSLINAGTRMGVLLGAVLGGFLVLLGANQLMSALFEALIPGFVNANNAFVAGMVRKNPVLMTVGTVILVPLAEECLFRGLLFTGFRKQNRMGAYALSVLAFCAVHVAGYIGQADALTLGLCFLQFIPAGIVLCMSCEKTDSLFAPMLIHAAVNLGSILFLRY